MTESHLETIFTANPKAGYLSLKAEIDEAIAGVLASSNYVLGPAVDRFESDFAAYVGVRHGVGVNSGTDALHLALRALGIGAGDEVVTVSHTSVATVAAIEMCGAAPVLVDIDPMWWTIDPQAVAAAIGPRTRAVIAVHLYGQPADMTALCDLCASAGLALIEDCAQSHGAIWQERMTGSFGSAACFSFYPTKNLGGIGDGGMVVTSDDSLASRMRMLRQYGWQRPQYSVMPGFNSRLDPLQAAILGVKLRHLDTMTGRRRQLARQYLETLARPFLELPVDRPHGTHAYHLFAMRAAMPKQRDSMISHLKTNGIAAAIHYPVPVHRQPAYANRLRTTSLQHTETLASTILSLPLYPEMTDAEQRRVIDALLRFQPDCECP